MIECLGYEQDWMGFDQGKNFSLKHLLLLWKKINNNPDFLQFLPDFFQVWNIPLQISRLFQEFKEFKALYEPFELVP